MTGRLSNKNASPEAVELYRFICENYGRRIISGVQECPSPKWCESEMNFLGEQVGRLPVIRGLDFIHDDYDGVLRRSKEWHGRGGVVTVCWHTGLIGNTYPASKEELPEFEKLFEAESEEQKLLFGRWERATKVLGELRDEGIPVLWRPFHEFDGQWFWWGKGGAEVFIRLWRMMYDKFTSEYGLNNLIWVLGYSGAVKPGWYPGDGYCDVIGSDNYDGTTNSASWPRLRAVTESKPYALHEIGALPPIGDYEREGAVWSWFMNWHTQYLIRENSLDRLREYYYSPTVITLEEYVEMKKR